MRYRAIEDDGLVFEYARLADVGKYRKIAIAVEQQMQFDDLFRPVRGGPIQETGTEIDDA